MTLKALYQSVTHDSATHQSTIAAQLAREGSARRRLVQLYLHNTTDRLAAKRTRRSHGAARSMLRATMFALYKRIQGLPRYHLVGRARPKTQAREDRARGRAEQIQAPPFTATARQALTGRLL